MTGPLILSADPVTALGAATKQYVDARGPFLSLTGGTLTGPGNLVVGGTLNVTGALTASTSVTTPILANGTSLLTIQSNLAGASQVGGALRHVPTTGAIYNITSNNLASQTDQWTVNFVPVGNAGGAGTPLSGNSAVNSILITDVVQTSGNIQGLNITQNIAPNGNSASGSRVGLGVSMIQIGSNQGGTITNAGISSGGVINAFGRSNLGGSATLYAGALNGLNTVMGIQSGATFMAGGSGFEIDTAANTGSSYLSITQQLNIVLASHQVKGYMNENISIIIASQVGALADMMYGLRFNDQSAGNPFDPKAKLIYAGKSIGNAVPVVASNLDFGNTMVGAFHSRAPYYAEVPLQATGITSATRLTSDGWAASGFVYEASLTNSGSGYTSNPTVTVTGGTGAVVNASQGLGGVIAKPGVFTPGTGVPPEATAAVTGGGGASGAVALTMAGNTMNFAINTAVDFDARVVMRSTTGEAICWSCEFGARMAATASTTAIIGSPTWTQVWATAGAAAAIAISNPTADTTLGAINITVTPSSLTWTGGGMVRMTKTSRV